MIRQLALACVVVVVAGAGAARADEAQMRIVSCKGPDAVVEIYTPQSTLRGKGISNLMLNFTANGYYALDLTAADKGKSLEPVRVRMSGDGKFLIVDQYTRGLPQTRIPVRGGSVDFDDRYASHQTCGPVNAE
jgi:hypothetical protein